MSNGNSNKNKSKKAYPPYKLSGSRSIYKNLTIGLLLTVVVISTIAISISFFNASRNAKIQLEDKAEELITSLAKILDILLWNIDEEVIKDIGMSYAHNEFVAKLRIVDSRERVYFEIDKEIDAPLINRSKEIVYKNNSIGHIDISLTTKYYKEISRQFLWASTFIILVNLISLIIMIKFLLKWFLQNPLNYFSEVVSRYGPGNFDFTGLHVPSIEFQSFVTVLSEMGDKITDQMSELRKSEEKYRLLIENQTDMIVKFDTEGRLLFASPSYCETFDKSEDELLEKKFIPLIHEEDREVVAMAIANVYKPPYSSYVEERAMTKDGWRWQAWLNTAVLNEENEVESIIAVGRDIEKQKQAEQKLRESEEGYRELVDNAVVGFYQVDKEGKFAVANKRMAEIFGYNSPQEFLLNVDNVTELYVHPEERPKILKEIDEKGFIERKEVEFWNKDKKPICIRLNTRVATKGNTTILYEGLMEDITDQKEIEEDRNRLQIQLQQAHKMEAIGTLAGGIAHDFNNILSPIMMCSEMAMMELPSGSPLQQNMKQIFKAGERARDLVKQILTFARKQDKERIPIKISRILKEAIKLLRSTIPTTIDIQCDINSKQDTVLSDTTQLNQIIMNLCTNAAHAMEEKGGTLKINLTNENLDSESADAFPDLKPGRYVKLAVKDTGHGIEPQFMDKIFEPYFTTKEIGKGTGMGLALVHGIVKSYGGAVIVQSEVGKGTSFHVYLPLVDGDTDILETAKDSVQLPTGTERILFVDDEKAAVDVMQSMLENLGYNVTARTSSIEALEAFRNNPQGFDLVITDMTMPNMTGKDLAKEMMVIRPDIPIILCTGFSEKIDEKRAEEMGISAFVMKPIVLRHIANTIREVLGDPKK